MMGSGGIWRRAIVPALALSTALGASISLRAEEAVDVGARRQLFVDGSLIASVENVRQVLHHPVPREIAIRAEHPWEKYGVSYMAAFRDGDKFRAWYRVDAADTSQGPRHTMTAYAESTDGVHWVKPTLGIIEYNGSKENNLVWDGPGKNQAVFKDGNPAAPADERYKALLAKGIHGLVSPDGLHWRFVQEEPILQPGPFDSFNLAFWDDGTGQYVAYTRGVRTEGEVGKAMRPNFRGGVRWVRRATSKDFRHWTPLEPIQTGDAPIEHLYTNSTIRYARAPDWLLMFPSRHANVPMPTPDWPFGPGVNDVVLLSSRDGLHFDRTFLEAFLRPGLDEGNWHERSLYMEWGVLQTSPTELSLYAMQNWRLPTVHIRRYTLRPDGFVSLQAGYRGGEVVTRPVRFAGSELRLNYSASAVGSVRVEVQTADGRPIDGFALSDGPPLVGDKLDGPVGWKAGGDVSPLADQPVRLRFVMADADLYAFRFVEE